MAYGPIYAVRVEGSGSGMPAMNRYPEAASKTFKQGVPLVLVSGYLQEIDFSAQTIVHSFSTEPAHNLVAAGVEEGGTSEGTPQNMASGKIIPVGAWMKDGKVGVYHADGRTVFAISLKAGQTFSQALIASGTLYGLTKDGTTGFWYLDTADTSGDNAVLRVVDQDSRDNTWVFVQVDSTKRYFN